MRRSLLLAALAALTLAACGSSDDGGGSSTSGAAADQGAFPVTITHALGSTEVKAAPKRVAVVGYTDQEPLLALGVKPVGWMDWFSDKRLAKWPWEKGVVGDSDPKIISSGTQELDFEKTAAVRPDLIIGLYQSLKKGDYEKFSKIAPTVAQAKGEPYTTPWREMTMTAAKAVGREAKAKQLIGGIEDRYAAFRKAHPELQGKTAVMMDAGGAPKEYFAFKSTDPRGQFLRELGFKADPELDAAIKGFGSAISKERFDLFDKVDYVFLLRDPEVQKRIDADAVFQRTPAAKAGRAIGLDYGEGDNVGAAIAFNTVLSLPYGLDGLTKKLAAAR